VNPKGNIANNLIIIILVILLNCAFSTDADSIWVKNMFNSQETANIYIPEFDDGYGIAFSDINGDDLPDLYVTRFRELNRLLINKGIDNIFLDRTIKTGLGGNLSPHRLHNLELGASVIDFNNDGRKDVLTVGWGETTVLNKHANKLDFQNITQIVGIDHPISGNAGIWSDVNLDGKLDLFITDEHNANHLYIQTKVEKFVDQSGSYGLTSNDISQGAAIGDLNLDGYPDLYICNWFEPDQLLLNQKGKYFKQEQLFISHLTDSLNSNGVTFGDLDNDGDLDVLVTDRNRTTKIYRNDIDSTNSIINLIDVTASSNVLNIYPAYSGNIADFNNDGFLDIFFTNIGSNQLFINKGNLKFELVYEETVTEFDYPNANYSTGAAVADLENDGDLDLFVSNKDTYCELYINPLYSTGYLRFNVEGVYSNKDAIGTKLWLYDEANELVGLREISSSSGYLSTSELTAHFGVDTSSIYKLDVLFPSGRTIEIDEIVPNQTIKISEVKGILKVIKQIQKFVVSVIQHPVFLSSIGLILLLILIIGLFTFIAIKRYRWTPRQTTIFLSIVLAVIFILWSSMRTRPITETLGAQILLISTIIIFTAVFMEQLRKVNNKRYEYRKVLHRFSEDLIFIRSNPKLLDQLVTMIHSNLDTKFTGLIEIIKGNTKKQYFLPNDYIDLRGFTLSEKQVRTLLANPHLDKSQVIDEFSLALNEIDLIIPIKRQKELFGLLLVQGKDKKQFQQEDITLLTTVVNQASLAIENNLFIEETKSLTKSLTESRVGKKYVNELEDKNRNLEELYNELKETQSQLIQSEKMSSLGQLVAGVAHELNNPIGYLYANMKELQKYIDLLNQSKDGKIGIAPEYLKDDIDQVIKESIEGSERVKSIVENLRKFSRLDEAEFKYADIHEGLDSTIMLVKKKLSDRIQIHKKYTVLPMVSCMPGHLNQVFLNMLLNAIQAIEKEGNIWISTDLKNDNIVIKFKDDGIGIPKKNIDRLFEPFFTTKPIGTGTGLGLSISYGIIQEHGGGIKVKSKKKNGTTFIISIPYKPQI